MISTKIVTANFRRKMKKMSDYDRCLQKALKRVNFFLLRLLYLRISNPDSVGVKRNGSG